MTKGASVLIMDPLDSGVGASIEKAAAAKGVAGDRLRPAGARRQPQVLRQLQQRPGRHACSARAWSAASRPGRSASPNVLVMYGDPTDNNATLFAQGYNAVWPRSSSQASTSRWARPAGTWDPPTALTEFQGQYTAHPNINAVLMPNDENARADHPLPADTGRQGQDLPGDRPGRDPDRPAEHPLRLPVRHRLQADLPGGTGRRRAGACTCAPA